jgi:pantothenate kinase type III
VKLLAVDVGNTEVKRAVIDNGVVGELQRDLCAEIDRVAGEIALQDLPVALSSVRKQAGQTIKTALAAQKKKLAAEVDHLVTNPVSGFYTGMGADRIADICAAWTKYQGTPVLVIGLGTATTCTAASSAGVFKGGFITLGLGPLCAALTISLPELPAIDPRQAISLEPGFDVYSSVCRGTVCAHVAIVEGWITQFRRQIGSDLVIIATGGWSEVLAPHCSSIDEVDPFLTLKGIWTVARAAGVSAS